MASLIINSNTTNASFLNLFFGLVLVLRAIYIRVTFAFNVVYDKAPTFPQSPAIIFIQVCKAIFNFHDLSYFHFSVMINFCNKSFSREIWYLESREIWYMELFECYVREKKLCASIRDVNSMFFKPDLKIPTIFTNVNLFFSVTIFFKYIN